jgi:hypothetical protein
MIRILTLLLCLAATTMIHAAEIIPPTLDETHKGVDFTAKVEGTPPFTYQWYRGTDTDLKKEKLPAPEGAQQTLKLTPPYTAGLYSCEISNAAGKVTSKTFRLSITRQDTAADMQITIKQP